MKTFFLIAWNVENRIQVIASADRKRLPKWMRQWKDERIAQGENVTIYTLPVERVSEFGLNLIPAVGA